MPFQSEAQRRYLWMTNPKLAQKWVDEGAKSKGLPYHKTKRKHKRKGKRAHSRHRSGR